MIPPAPAPKIMHGGAFQQKAQNMISMFLPEGFPSSVSSSYLRYSSWSMAASIFTSASGVLATSSLLVALGVGSQALPLSAATTWVLKDGLGQLGGMLSAALLGNRFDLDPKRWRQVSAIAQDSAGALEVCVLALAPIITLPFLPCAAAANVARNVAWLSASATRASLHSSLARRGNLADITAKAGSQTTAAYTLGTALGVTLSMISSDPTIALALYTTLALGHQGCVYLSLKAIPLVTLSPARLHLAWEKVVNCFSQTTFEGIRTPEQVLALETFLPWLPVTPHTQSKQVTILEDEHTLANEKVGKAGVGTEWEAFEVQGEAIPSHAIVAGRGGEIFLILGQNAGLRDVLLAHLHGARVSTELEKIRKVSIESGDLEAALPLEARVQAVQRARTWVDSHGEDIISKMESLGWRTAEPLLPGCLGNVRWEFTSRGDEDEKPVVREK